MKTSIWNRISWLLFATVFAIQALNSQASSTPPTISSPPTGATKITGGSYTFSVTATSSNLNYQWYQDGSAVSAATSRTLALNPLKKSDAGSYSVIVTNDGGSVTSTPPAVLVVQDPPVITNLTGTVTNIIAVGHSVTMTVRASGDSLAYVWKKGTTVLSGSTDSANSSSFTIPSVGINDAGAYSCRVANGVGTNTASFQLIAVAAPAITTDLHSTAAVATGSNCTLSVTATGAYLHYFWTLNATNPVGSDTNKLTITGASSANAGVYSVVVSNLCNTATSASCTLFVEGFPTVVSQPATTNIVATNTSLTLSVSVSGDSLAYQWYKGTTAVSSGGNASNLVFSSVSTGDAGTYSVTVTNHTGKVTSHNSVLIPVVAPKITSQPVGKGLAIGTNYTLSVAASGSYLHYFWALNGTNQLTGDANKFTITGADASDAGAYSVIVSNLAGTVTSSSATITVQAPPTIIAQPTSTNIVATNTSLTLSVTATGDSLAYQWYKGTAAIPNATHTNLVFSGILSSDAASYTVTISNFAGKVTSAKAVVIPVVAPKITTQPVGKGLAIGTNYTLSVAASGSYLHYFWALNQTNYVGGDSNKLAIVGSDYTDSGAYSVIVSNLAGTVTSSNAVVTVQRLPQISDYYSVRRLGSGNWIETQGLTNIVATNSILDLWVDLSGDDLSWQWYKGNVAIPGATNNDQLMLDGAMFRINSLSITDAATYKIVINNFAGTVTSSNFVVIPVVAPKITKQPVGKGLVFGTNYTLRVAANGSYLHYYWFLNATNYVGGDSNKLAIVNADYSDSGAYSVIVSNLSGVVTSSNAVVIVQRPPQIDDYWTFSYPLGGSGNPDNWRFTYALTNIVATNNFLELRVDVFGDDLSWQWYKNKVAIPGANRGFGESGMSQADLDFNSLSITDAASYSVTFSNYAGTVTSSNFVLIPVVAPKITTQPIGKGLVAGTNYTMTVAATAGYLHYYWFLNVTNHVGGDSNRLAIVNADSTDAGVYSVIVSNLAAAVTSSNAFVEVQVPPFIVTQPTPTNIVATNTSLTLSVSATGDSLAYQWYKGTAAIPGATRSNLVFESVSTTNAASYTVTITNFAGKVTSAKAVVIAVVAPKITTQPVGKGIAVGTNYTLSVAASGAYLHYFWALNGTNHLTGDTNKITIAHAATTDAGTYTVVVSNLAATVTSSNAVLIVQVPPSITTPPHDSKYAVGSTISLSVVAAGDGLGFLWTKDGKALTNSNVSTLTITNASLADGGKYQVTVSNAVSSVKSTNATVTVIAPPVLKPAAVNVSILQSASAILQVTATGTGPIGYQWSFNGTNALAGATNTTYALTNMAAGKAGFYQLTATNFGGSTVTNITVTYLADTNPPTVTLTGAGATISNANLSVTGKATDNVAVSSVVFSINGGTSYADATTTNGWTNFVISATLTNIGTNMLTVVATDINGNFVRSTNHPVYAPLYTLAISTVGRGTVATNWTGKVQWGKTYTVTAQPGLNQVLVGWTGDVTTNVTSFKFSPTNNMALTATFTTNLFIGYQGTYNGLFSSTNLGTTLAESGGFLTLAVTTNQTYSGKIYVQGLSASLSGSFHVDGTVSNRVSLATNGPTLTLVLHMDFADKQLLGTIASGSDWSSDLQADLAVFSATHPTTNVGTYTLVIPTQTGKGLGYGSGTLIVRSNGAVSFVGVAADDTALSQSTSLSQDATLPLYMALYPDSDKIDQGLMMGWLQFTNPLPSGTLFWISPSTNNTLLESIADIQSSAFTAPATGTHRVLTNHLATITFIGAGLTSPFSETMIIADDGTVSTDGAASIVISTTGIISGTMVDPTSETSSKIYGIVLQHNPSSLGKGSIAGPSSIGKFEITPYP